MNERFRYWRTYPPAHVLLRAIAVWAGAIDQGKLDPAPGERNVISLEAFREQYPDGIKVHHLGG